MLRPDVEARSLYELLSGRSIFQAKSGHQQGRAALPAATSVSVLSYVWSAARRFAPTSNQPLQESQLTEAQAKLRGIGAGYTFRYDVLR